MGKGQTDLVVIQTSVIANCNGWKEKRVETCSFAAISFKLCIYLSQFILYNLRLAVISLETSSVFFISHKC